MTHDFMLSFNQGLYNDWKPSKNDLKLNEE